MSEAVGTQRALTGSHNIFTVGVPPLGEYKLSSFLFLKETERERNLGEALVHPCVFKVCIKNLEKAEEDARKMERW